jgi:hypothetical protein
MRTASSSSRGERRLSVGAQADSPSVVIVFGSIRAWLKRCGHASLVGVVLVLSACPSPLDNVAPTNQPVFPTGLSVDPSGRFLAVVSSNYDQRYSSGALMLADLDKVDAVLPEDAQQQDPVIDDAYVSSIALASFGERPVFVDGGNTILVTTRGNNAVQAIRMSNDDVPVLDCNADALGCQQPFALQLPYNDPFELLTLDDNNGSVRAVVTSLASGRLEFLSIDVASAQPSLRLENNGALLVGNDVSAVRSVARVADGRLVVGVERKPASVTVSVPQPVELAMLAPPPVDNANVAVIDRVAVGAINGSVGMRDVRTVPAHGDQPESLLVLLRRPDALNRIDLSGNDGVTISATAPTCKDPTSLSLVQPQASRVFAVVTCLAGTISVVDVDTLQVMDTIRFWGRQPYATAQRPGRLGTPGNEEVDLYVSFFLDNSVGVLRMRSDGTLIRRGRIGTPTPRPEDGRE